MSSAQSLETLPRTFSISDIPDEVLIHVMSFLSIYDRKTTRLVSKQWNKLSYSYPLIKNDWVVLRSLRTMLDMHQLPNQWRCVNLRILTVGHAYQGSDVWERFGSHIQKIDLYKLSLQNPVFIDIFKFCTDLRSLELHEGLPRKKNGVSFAKLAPIPPSRLECLKFENIFNLTEEEFTVLTRNAHKLTEFYLFNYYFTMSGVAHYLDPCFRSVMGKDSRSDYDFVKISSLVNLIKRQSTRLTHLAIVSTDLPVEAGIEILASAGKTLKHLGIPMDDRVESYIEPISENCCDLEAINLYGQVFSFGALNNETASKLFRSLPNVRKVYIHAVHSDFGNAISSLTKLEFLSEITLTKCSSISDLDLAKLGERPMPNIKHLSFRCMRRVNDEVIMKIAPMVPNIIRWSLKETKVGNGGFNSIVANNKLLQHLWITETDNLTTIVPGINQLTELRSLDLSACGNIPTESFNSLSLKKLKTLGLFGCGYNGDLKTIVDACPNLADVYLDFPIELDTMRPRVHFGIMNGTKTGIEPTPVTSLIHGIFMLRNFYYFLLPGIFQVVLAAVMLYYAVGYYYYFK